LTLEQRAKKVRDELFSRYDQINALWLKAEEQITQFHIPQPVQFTYGSYNLEDPGPYYCEVCECLGLFKIKGKWRICYGSFLPDHEGGPNEWTPITEASAQIRIEAASHLPDLKKAVVESAEKFVPKVDQAIQALAAALKQPDNLAELLAERAKLNGQTQ
jgi:hypothetical protein